MKKITLIAAILASLLWAGEAFAEITVLPNRVIDGRTMTVIDMEGLVARCSQADVVAFGENHDDPATHIAELAVLEGIFRYHQNVVLSLEMFERDVQPVLEQYLLGEIGEEEFLANSHPWGNYETDYRPMVQFAGENGLKVVAANIPRFLASRVASGGFDAAVFTDEERPWMASTFEPMRDGYWDAFAATMMMPGMEAMNVSEETVWQIYEAQVTKDETMAESITTAFVENPDSIIYHVTGTFHVADYFGTFSRVKRNLPGADCVLIVALPVDDLLAGIPDDAPKADYYILVQAPEMIDVDVMPPMPPMPPVTSLSEDAPETESESE